MKLINLLIATILFAGTASADTVIMTSTKTIDVTPTIDTNIYASGDALGGLQTLTDAAREGTYSGVIHSVVVTDLASQGADIDVIIFSANPSGTTFTNNATLDIADADLVKVICVIQVTNDATFADNGASYAHGNNCVFSMQGTLSTTLYAAAVVRGTPTYASASDLRFRYSILQD